MLTIPPPPPRYPSAPGSSGNVLLPPPPGPPPSSSFPSSAIPPPSALGSAPWHGAWGRAYDGRTTFNIPPPPPGGGGPTVLQAYNPKLHAQALAAANAATSSGQTLTVPPPPPPSEQMSATYIPQGDTYGEGVGIPGLGFTDEFIHGWGLGSQLDSATATPLDEMSGRDRLYVTALGQRGSSTASHATIPSSVPPEVASQWPLNKVLAWLQVNNFSKDWQETFKTLHIYGAQFLELGSSHGGRGNFGMMHQQVYPQLAKECALNGSRWDQPKEREEGKRMRRLIRGIVTGRPFEPSKPSSGHTRKESAATAAASSAATESAESPNVS
jgi:mitogen-activated protein kinase kinase kinase